MVVLTDYYLEDYRLAAGVTLWATATDLNSALFVLALQRLPVETNWNPSYPRDHCQRSHSVQRHDGLQAACWQNGSVPLLFLVEKSFFKLQWILKSTFPKTWTFFNLANIKKNHSSSSYERGCVLPARYTGWFRTSHPGHHTRAFLPEPLQSPVWRHFIAFSFV